jgi:integrase/recombinase XerC
VVALLGWGEALMQYIQHMQAAGRAPGTIRLHRHYLSLLADRHRHPWTVTTVQLVAFMACDTWSPETRKSARTVVASFYRWGHGMGYVSDDPALHLPTVRVPAGVPRPAPEHLVLQLARRDDRLGFMAMLAAYGGLRAAEISRVHGRDFVDETLIVLGKGGKTRAVPVVYPPLLERLDGVGDAWAFPNRQGGHVSPGHVTKLLSAAMPPGWTAHTLRHRMATQAYAGTRDLLAVGAVLGHSRPETTQRYVRMPDDALRAAARAAC